MRIVARNVVVVDLGHTAVISTGMNPKTVSPSQATNQVCEREVQNG